MVAPAATLTGGLAAGPPSDPFGKIYDLDDGANTQGVFFGTVAALLLHAALAAYSASSLFEMQRFALGVHETLKEQSTLKVDVDLEKPPNPPPQPEPEPPKAEPAPPSRQDPPEIPQPPPAAAQAGQLLAAEADPNAPLDLTGEGWVTGSADSFAGGVTAAKGTSQKAVYDRSATPSGVGQALKAIAPIADLSEPARAASRSWNDCGFPAEADAEQIDYARVRIVVTVRPDGAAKSVDVVQDPGYGFGQLAKRCALRKAYSAASDRSGGKITATTAPFWVTFKRH